jgi:putative glutamine amidotransferase
VRKPLIGITPGSSIDTLSHGTFERYSINAAYCNAILAAGGIPVVLPFQEDAAAVVQSLDGLLLTGGSDIEPSRFGATEIHPETYGIAPARDQFELDLFHHSLERNLPILGVCRGIQVVNVALGGTLIQDIPTEHLTGNPIQHRQQKNEIAANQPGHDVTIDAGTWLHERVGDSTLPVNSFHHQAIANPGSGLEIIARAPDGIIEAVAMPDRPFVFAVQWHPELMFVDHPAHLIPFQGLVDAATVRLAEPALA